MQSNLVGTVNLSHKNIRKRKRHYLVDLFTTLVDIKWRFILLLFLLAFIASWTTFAIIWWVIVLVHGDSNDDASRAMASSTSGLTAGTSAAANSSTSIAQKPVHDSNATFYNFLNTALEAERKRLVQDDVRCLAQITDFGAALLFSIETQQTIGFGYRYLTDNCKPVTITILMLQSCCGVIIQALMTGTAIEYSLTL